MRTLGIILCMALGTMGCEKNNIDTAELAHNPFDADYSGPALFEVEGATTSTWVDNDGIPHRQLLVRVRTRTTYFTHAASYHVECAPPTGGTVVLDPGPTNVFDLPPLNDVVTGQTYEWQLNVKSGLGTGGGNTVQATAQ